MSSEDESSLASERLLLEAELARLRADHARARSQRVLGFLAGLCLAPLGVWLVASSLETFLTTDAPRASRHTQCGGAQVDVMDDPANCGSCGNVCSFERPVCIQGECTCEDGLTACSDTEACTDLGADPQHCGGCDVACERGISCVHGRCVCAEGETVCLDRSGERSVRLCVDTARDRDHCGSCDVRCIVGTSCVRGTCRERLTPPDESAPALRLGP